MHAGYLYVCHRSSGSIVLDIICMKVKRSFNIDY